jgi:squalene-associated FAD-dependent desaturase
MSPSTTSQTRPTVIVIGGGPAGLSAAAELVAHGIRVILIEGQRVLGGRASSHLHRSSGEILDLGAHTVIESNRNFLNHLAKVGTRDQIVFPPSLRIRFVHSERGIADFHSPRLPASWGFLSGLLTYRFLPIVDRIHAIRLGRFLASTSGDRLPDIAIDQWFDDRKVSATAREVFWEPLILAALNNQPRKLGLRSLGTVFRSGFLARGQRTGLGVPKVDWGKLVEGNLREQITSSGGEVITGKRVEQIWMPDGEAGGAIIQGGRCVEGDAIIAAISPWDLLKLLPAEPSWLTPALQFEWSPIESLHWIASNPLPVQTPIALLDGPVQWIFSRPISSGSGKAIISMISGSDHALMAEDRSTVVAEISSCIRRLFPLWDPGSDDQIILYRIRHATISIGPGQDMTRPGPDTDLPGLWIAGDWTNTSLPPTLESAALSGINSARHALNDFEL